jgi:hypothetical protein
MWLIVREKIAASGAALAGGNHVLIGAVGVHDEDLVALQLVARGLEDQPLPIRSPVRFGVLSAERQLPDVVQMRRGLRCERRCHQNVE